MDDLVRAEDIEPDGIAVQILIAGIHAFRQKWPEAEFGPAHIVLSDYNLMDGHIRWCVGLCRAALSGHTSDLTERSDEAFMHSVDWYRRQDRTEMIATIEFLEWLLMFSKTTREAAERNAAV